MLMPWLINRSVLMMLLILALILSSIYGATSSHSDSPHWMKTDCPENSVNISGSAFEASLNDSLSQLLTNTSSVGFSNVTKGAGENQVYALFYCSGDVDLETCKDCVEEATRKIRDDCKFSKEGVVWFEECTLRYANRTIFSIDAVDPYFLTRNHSSAVSESRLDGYANKFDETMKTLVQQAAYGKGRSLPGFATKEVILSSTEIMRGVAQCTPDILGPGCDRCLSAALRIRYSWANTIVFLPSCFFRYDLFVTGELSASAPSLPPSTRRGSHIALKITIPAVFIVLAVIGCAWLWIKKRHVLQGNFLASRDINTPSVRPISPVDVQQKAQGLRKYTYSQVKQMTNNFTTEVGKGGYGVVYRGTLLDDTKDVAVKVLNQNNASEQFTNEINVLAGISHRNIVSLLGHCQDKNRLALIYEFMDKGDLRSLLSGNPGSLSWRDRLMIAIDTAEGLDYLHYHSNDRVVHRDVKPANILLNGDIQAKLADFGSCKIFPKDATTVRTQVVSTPGYTDPEYFNTGLLNMKADVYSFGIVLVELITGKVPNSSNYVELFVNTLSEGDIEQILDPNIARDLEDGSVWGAIELARECVKTDETERPDMSEVLTTLKCLDTDVRRNAGNSNRASTSMGIMNATNSDSISMVPDPR